MGWLKPEAQLIQAPQWATGNGGAHVAPAQPIPEYSVPYFGQVVSGSRIDGLKVTSTEVTIDSGFEFCPDLVKYGYPLMLKREVLPEDNQEVELGLDELAMKMFIIRLMTEETQGLSPIFELGGARQPMPVILAARADGEPFFRHEFRRLKDFFDHYMPMNDVMAHVDGACGGPDMCRTEEEFQIKLKTWCTPYVPKAEREKVPTLEELFPLGRRVEAQDLSKTELNSLVGIITKYDMKSRRIGVDFGPPYGLLALRPKNLILLRQLEIEAAPGVEEPSAPAENDMLE
mmetsp:Transcript_26381/g.43850  ORF Transcript_26381/g.43850 Transcript_26381/m.43850 type:complete len:288 (+) Transcript_26381:17-880(+)